MLTVTTRDKTREQLHANFDSESDEWMVGSKAGITRVPLDCLGLWHQLHWNGHEKIGL
jgi:hypothetical protein